MLIGNCSVYFPGARIALVIPPQGRRCLAWNALMLVVLGVFVSVTPASLTGGVLWYGFLALVGVNVMLSLRTVFVDPGFVPPVLRGEVDDGCGVQEPNPLLQAIDPSYTEDMFSLLYCRTCRHLRPKNCSHCKFCDACVRDFDHHCTVLGCCIGGRNVGSFIAYLFSVALSAAYGTFILATGLSQQQESLNLSSPLLYVYIALFLCGAGTAASVGFFACYYTFLVLSGKSSKQFLTSANAVDSSFGVRMLFRSLFCPTMSLLPAYLEWMADEAQRDSHKPGAREAC